METVDAIRAVPLFADLPDSVTARLAQMIVRRSYRAGEVIFVEGEPCRAAYIVSEGRVRIYRTSMGGREQVLASLGPGQAFNTVPAFQHLGRNHATADAMCDSTVYVILRQDLLAAVRAFPDMALAILQDFAERLDHLTSLVEDLSLRSVRGRLARFLLVHAEDGAVRHRWTQDEMASELGTVRDVIGRALRSFAEEGLVRLNRHRIELLDRASLEAEAER